MSMLSDLSSMSVNSMNDLDESSCLGDLTLDPPVTSSMDQVREDLYRSNEACIARGLNHYSVWISEQLLHLAPPSSPSMVTCQARTWTEDCDAITFSLQLMHKQEYIRAESLLENSTTQHGVFLRLYCRYLAGEKRRLEEVDLKNRRNVSNLALKDLRVDLEALRQQQKLDAYGLWLYGVVLGKSSHCEKAVNILVESLHKDPSFWGSWEQLAKLITNKSQLQSLPALPNHWIKSFFYVEVCQEMFFANDAISYIQALEDMGMVNNPYLMSKRAQVHYTLREYDIAKDVFKELLAKDLYRLDVVDMYSNILFVKEDKATLNYLAHHTIKVDKYRSETCCVVGNFYSMCDQHEKAITYFQRALSLDPDYLSAWTLMGHEYVELKNTNMAIECYRNAIDVNPRDYRAWYAIGQTYEVLKMHAYCLYYYMEAQRLRPTDSRMIMALGESYEKLDQNAKAKKCYVRALNVGDQEDIAMIRLARVCEMLNEEEGAVRWYSRYIDMVHSGVIEAGEDICFAHRYLAQYYLRNDRLSEADVHAHKCGEYKETKNDGKALVRQIAAVRNPSTRNTLARVISLELSPDNDMSFG